MSREPIATIEPDQSQLFIDDTWIADSSKLGRVFHQARKLPETVLRADRPWERFAICIFGTVLRRGDLFQAWYMTWTRDSPCKVCYAESADGIAWDKPNLGLHAFDGSTDNNICLVGDGGAGIDCIGVIDDPEDEAWPLKAIYWQGGERRGLCAARSQDGKTWEKRPGLVLPGWGDRTNVMAHKDRGKYVILGRAPGASGRYGVRLVSRTESRDLRRWSEPRLILRPDHEDEAMTQFYSATAFRYESQYLGFIERMYVSPDKVDAELVHSRDGWTWCRTRPRGRFIEWGAPGTWDDTWLNVGTGGPIPHGGHLWFYYSGRAGAHGDKMPHNFGHIGLATLRVDGFASLQSRETPGWVETPPLRWPGGELAVNVDCRRNLLAHFRSCQGQVCVEVRGPSGRPLKGYGVDDCVPISQNTAGGWGSGGAFAPVAWGDGTRSMKRHKGKTVRLVFHVQDAHLYAFKAQS